MCVHMHTYEFECARVCVRVQAPDANLQINTWPSQHLGSLYAPDTAGI